MDWAAGKVTAKRRVIRQLFAGAPPNSSHGGKLFQWITRRRQHRIPLIRSKKPGCPIIRPSVTAQNGVNQIRNTQARFLRGVHLPLAALEPAAAVDQHEQVIIP